MKKGGPEFVKRAPEGLSLFKITPPKASSFFAPRGAMWFGGLVGLLGTTGGGGSSGHHWWPAWFGQAGPRFGCDEEYLQPNYTI